ncbi:MAG: transcription antitermination factor NusB [Coriobacteriales bacterium]|jgi:16S rRNA (cytosine967-C5)-methyltransferase
MSDDNRNSGSRGNGNGGSHSGSGGARGGSHGNGSYGKSRGGNRGGKSGNGGSRGKSHSGSGSHGGSRGDSGSKGGSYGRGGSKGNSHGGSNSKGGYGSKGGKNGDSRNDSRSGFRDSYKSKGGSKGGSRSDSHSSFHDDYKSKGGSKNGSRSDSHSSSRDGYKSKGEHKGGSRSDSRISSKDGYKSKSGPRSDSRSDSNGGYKSNGGNRFDYHDEHNSGHYPHGSHGDFRHDDHSRNSDGPRTYKGVSRGEVGLRPPKHREDGGRYGDRRSEGYHSNKLSPGRRLALKTVRRVRERDAFVQQVASSVIRKAKVQPEDKAFAELLATGVVSTWGTLDEIIDRSLKHRDDIEPEVRDALRISVYELVFLKKQDHAAVDQGVELVREVAPRAANLANAVLHRIIEDIGLFPWGNPNTDDEALARKLGFPYWMTDMLIDSLGRDAAVVFMMASNDPAPVFMCANNVTSSSEELFEDLERIGGEPKYVGPKDRGCIEVGDTRAALRSDLLKDGRALVSDASAQLAALIGTPVKGKRFLEIGSGRGTKTVMLQSNALKYNGEQCEMHCVDLHAFKNNVLAQRIATTKLDNVTLYEGDATDLDSIEGLPESFGKIFIDAPCSGVGTLRRHPEIRWNLTQRDIDSLGGVGLAMLKSASRRIEPGGTIVFSTCTVTEEENQDVIKAFLESEEGAGFALRDVNGKGWIMNQLVPGGPDVHFIAQLVRRG